MKARKGYEWINSVPHVWAVAGTGEIKQLPIKQKYEELFFRLMKIGNIYPNREEARKALARVKEAFKGGA